MHSNIDWVNGVHTLFKPWLVCVTIFLQDSLPTILWNRKPPAKRERSSDASRFHFYIICVLIVVAFPVHNVKP